MSGISPLMLLKLLVCAKTVGPAIFWFLSQSKTEEERVAMHMKHVLGAVGLAALLLLRLVKHESVNHVKAP